MGTLRSLTVRQLATFAVVTVAIAAVIGAVDPADHAGRRLLTDLGPAGPPALGHVLGLWAGLSLVVLAPKVLRGTRAALPVAIVALAALSVLHIMRPLGFAAAAVALGLAFVLAFGRRAFALGSRNRPRRALVFAASGAWALAYLAVLADPLVSAHGHDIRLAVHHAIGHVLRVSLAPPTVSGTWIRVIEVLIGCATTISLLVLRSLLRPAAGRSGHSYEEHDAARILVQRYGEDSLSWFVLRPDKSFHFDGDGVLAYMVVGDTAVVSGEPVGHRRAAPAVLETFMDAARSRGWDVVVYGASADQLEAYHRLGLRSVCVGEEAVARPAGFSLDGRRVRKLRQSVHRVQRRGWQIAVRDGVEIDPETEAEINELDAQWRAGQRRVLGFAMSMGQFEAGIGPADLYLLARSPDGTLAAVMRFISHRGKLSLDTMRRVGETPNGLNEALVCRALEIARERGISEVSLNYAGLAHLIRRPARGGRVRRRAIKLGLSVLGRHFQMERLICFNDKFSPEWRPRYLVYPSRRSLPKAVYRVLQAEGYIRPARHSSRPPAPAASPRPRAGILPVHADAPGR